MHRRTDPAHAPVEADRQEGLVSVAQARAGGLTDRRLEGLVHRHEWARVARGVYDTTPRADRSWPARRRRAAWTALLAFGPDAVAVGSCALALLGVEGLPTSIRPEAALPGAGNRHDRDGIALRQFDDGMRCVEVAGRLVAAPEWALAQAVPELPRRHGLAVLDSALHRGLLDRHGLDRAHDRARGRRGVARTHPLWELADGRAESPLESFARLECIDAGVPPDVLQLPVDGGFGVHARGDLAWRRRVRWLVVEMDGREVHDRPDAVFADRSRQNGIVLTGAVDVLRFTGSDLGRIAPAVRRALAA